MRHRSGPLAAALIVTLALATGTAAASRSLTGGGAFRLTTRAFDFLIDETGELVFSCSLTLGGSLHARVAKARGTLAGAITEASAVCPPVTDAMVLVEAARPLHLTYQSFSGTLPRISAVRLELVRLALLYTFGLRRCLMVGTVPLNVTGTTGGAELTITRVELPSTSLMLVRELAGLCPTRLRVASTFASSPGVTLRLA